MIVLDEQLLGRNLEREIGAWYPGAVCFITELRPRTVIKDDAIPSILREQSQATFVTINTTDFWEIVEITADFCVLVTLMRDEHSLEHCGKLERGGVNWKSSQPLERKSWV